MSQTLTFHNPGHLDPKSFKYMGLSVKSEGSFGRFGTGLKYAIANILRNGDSIEIHTQGQRYFFKLGDMEFRGKNFKPILCNGEELGITTELGKHWEPWMAYRELYCNAKDEQGGVKEGTLKQAQDTMVIVTGTSLSQVHAERQNYFLDPSLTPASSTDNGEIYDRPSQALFYQGIRVIELSSKFTYNLKRDVTLTEDRTMSDSWSVRYKLARLVAQSSNISLIEKIVTRDYDSGYAEHYLDFGTVSKPSEDFLYVCEQMYKKNRKVPNGFYEKFRKLRPDLFKPKEVDVTDKHQRMLNKVISFLKNGGYDITRYPIKIVESTGVELLGEGNETITLTEEAFNRGLFDLAHTVLEEYFHIHTGLQDETRDFQNYLFKQLITQLQDEYNIL